MASLRSNVRKPYTRPPNRGNAEGQWLHDKFGNAHQRREQVSNGAAVVSPALPAGISNRLKVTNLHYEVTPKDLNTIFGQIGTLVREPLLWYDESGRSTGRAVVTFETAAEATRAKNQFDGILAKGQPMQVEFYHQPRGPRRATSEPTSLSLLARIEKPPLLDRLASDDTATTAVGRKNHAQGKGRVGPIRAKAPRPTKTKHTKKQPKSAEDLDKELDAFMGDVEPTSQNVASSSGAAQDVDMA